MVMRNWMLMLSTAAILVMTVSIPAFAQEQSTSKASDESPPRFGSPDQVDNLIEADESSISRTIEKRLSEPYFKWKKSIQEKYGLAFGVDYSMAYAAAHDHPPGAEDNAGSGIARFFGSWEIVGRESGNTGAFAAQGARCVDERDEGRARARAGFRA